jgi:hypothetical protein
VGASSLLNRHGRDKPGHDGPAMTATCYMGHNQRDLVLGVKNFLVLASELAGALVGCLRVMM